MYLYIYIYIYIYICELRALGGRACPRPWVSRRPPSIAGALGKEFINHVWWCVRAAQSMALDTMTHKQKRQTSIKVPS